MPKKLPKTIYVAWSGESKSTYPYLNAQTDRESVIDDDGPTIVGTYQLIEQHELSKVVQAKPKRG